MFEDRYADMAITELKEELVEYHGYSWSSLDDYSRQDLINTLESRRRAEAEAGEVQ